ncbi:hypothetical protein MMC26_002257 [Xylographa opegraphella]|nr:hypothetical protein [Xylographa opegraphella]
MSGAEVLIILPIVAALISAFKDGTDLGQKTRDWWKRHWGKEQNAQKATAESELAQSLTVNPGRIWRGYTDNVQRYGPQFKIGDDVARMELMWCLLDMHRDMLSVCKLMLQERIEYDPSRLQRTSDQIRDRSLGSFHSLAQRLEIQAPIPPPLAIDPYPNWNAPRISRVQTLQTISSTDEANDELDEEKARLNTLAERYVAALSHSSRPQSPAASPAELSSEFDAFCQGPVEECFSSGSLSLWQCRNCGSSISFDYNKVDRSQGFANLVFSCHLPVRSETVKYKCIICRAIGEPQNMLQIYGEKGQLISHLCTHTAQDFGEAGFSESILDSLCDI